MLKLAVFLKGMKTVEEKLTVIKETAIPLTTVSTSGEKSVAFGADEFTSGKEASNISE